MRPWESHNLGLIYKMGINKWFLPPHKMVGSFKWDSAWKVVSGKYLIKISLYCYVLMLLYMWINVGTMLNFLK